MRAETKAPLTSPPLRVSCSWFLCILFPILRPCPVLLLLISHWFHPVLSLLTSRRFCPAPSLLPSHWFSPALNSRSLLNSHPSSLSHHLLLVSGFQFLCYHLSVFLLTLCQLQLMPLLSSLKIIYTYLGLSCCWHLWTSSPLLYSLHLAPAISISHRSQALSLRSLVVSHPGCNPLLCRYTSGLRSIRSALA